MRARFQQEMECRRFILTTLDCSKPLAFPIRGGYKVVMISPECDCLRNIRFDLLPMIVWPFVSLDIN